MTLHRSVYGGYATLATSFTIPLTRLGKRFYSSGKEVKAFPVRAIAPSGGIAIPAYVQARTVSSRITTSRRVLGIIGGSDTSVILP